jgi:hypothetical protein
MPDPNALHGHSESGRRTERALMQMLYDRAAQKPNAPIVSEMADRLAAISLTFERVYEMTLDAAKIASPSTWSGAEDACFRRGRDEAIEAIRDELERWRKQQDEADRG